MTAPSLRPAGAHPTDDPVAALSNLLAAWAARPDSPEAFAARARPLTERAEPTLGGMGFAAEAIDPRAAAASAVAQTEAAHREAIRTLAAIAASRLDPGAAAFLFSPEQGWDPGDPIAAASGVLYAELARDDRPYEGGIVDRICGRAEPRLRAIALQMQLAAAIRRGLPRILLSRLLVALIRAPEIAPRVSRTAAELLWLFDLPALAAPFLRRFPDLATDAERDPLLALLVTRNGRRGVPPSRRAAVEASAARLERVERSTAAFWARVADPAVRVAVVGNSPCETGRGRGAEIDGHDVVVRFNDAPEDGRFAADYGARCDVKAFATRNAKEGRIATHAPVVVLRRQRVVVERGMALAEDIIGRGGEVAYVPATLMAALRAEIGRPPSTGLAFLAQLRAVRGSLRNVSCFGFSLTDQIEPDAASAHYFDVFQVRHGHAWRAERAIFDAWTAGGG